MMLALLLEHAALAPSPPRPPRKLPPPESPPMLPTTSFRCVDCHHKCPYDCTEWEGKECGNPSQYGVFDVDAELLTAICPEACADGIKMCAPFPPPPPPLPPQRPPLPSPPPSPPLRCTDDESYYEAGWRCVDWTNWTCSGTDTSVDVARLVWSCPRACADAEPYCLSPPPPPHPPPPPPNFLKCTRSSFSDNAEAAAATGITAGLTLLLLLLCGRRCSPPHRPNAGGWVWRWSGGWELLSRKPRPTRLTGPATWLAMLVAPGVAWLCITAPYVTCYGSPVAALLAILLLVFSTLAMGSNAGPALSLIRPCPSTRAPSACRHGRLQ